MADVKNIPGSEPVPLGRINEIIRGATIKGFHVDKARDPDHGGEVLRMDIGNGDFLLFFAIPNPGVIVEPDAPTAYLQTFLVHRNKTKLKV